MARDHSLTEGPDVISDADRQVARGNVPRQGQHGAITGPAAVAPDLWLLHVTYQRTRSPELLAQLVNEYQGYARALANRLHRDGESREELQQVASEALVAALQRFDCERRVPFPGFATPTIIGSLKRHYRDLGWTIRVPRAVHEMAGPVREAAERLARRNGRAATVKEIADELGIDPGTITLVQSATRARTPLSLDAPVRPDSDTCLDPAITDESFELAENRVALTGALGALDDRSRTVVGLYYFEGLSQTEIAERFGVSQMQVSRWIHAALRRLRARMSPGADDHREIDESTGLHSGVG